MKFKRILFPIDFSPTCRAMNPEVEWLAKTFNAEVILLHVFEIPMTWYGSAMGEPPLLNEAFVQDNLNTLREKLNKYVLDVTESRIRRIVVEGEPAFQIQRTVEDNKIDLIVMGTHGYGPLRRLLLGSVALKVLHDVECPVWTHATTHTIIAPKEIKSIICAVEFDDEAEALLRFTKELAQAFHAEVHLVNCVPRDTTVPFRYFDQDLQHLLVKTAAEDLARLQARAGTEFHAEIAQLPITESIAVAVQDHNANLVITGRGKARQVFGGLRSHSSGIIREVACPVLSYCAHQDQIAQDKAAEDRTYEKLIVA